MPDKKWRNIPDGIQLPPGIYTACIRHFLWEKYEKSLDDLIGEYGSIIVNIIKDYYDKERPGNECILALADEFNLKLSWKRQE